MLRVALTEIALFAAPFIVFAIYLRVGRGVDSLLAGWTTLSFGVCAAIAVALVAGSLLFIESTGRGGTTGAYVPPTWKDGVLVPGHIE